MVKMSDNNLINLQALTKGQVEVVHIGPIFTLKTNEKMRMDPIYGFLCNFSRSRNFQVTRQSLEAMIVSLSD